MVAVALSTIILSLVTSVFFAQNRLYQDLSTRSEVQAGARAVAELLVTEVRQAGRGGVVLAEPDSLALRTPQVLGVICSIDSDNAYVYLVLDGEELDTAEVTGYGVRVTGGWDFYAAAWGALDGGSESTARSRCLDAGVDTAGTHLSDFRRLDGVGGDPTPAPSGGDLVMIFRELEYRIESSELAGGARGLFRGNHGGTLVELATGMADDAGFAYRLEGETTFSDAVSSSDLENIVAVRVRSSLAQWSVAPGDRTPYSYDLTVDIPLRNARR